MKFSISKMVYTLGTLVLFLGANNALAEEAAGGGGKGAWAPLGAALAIGLAAFGGALGQGKTAAAALEGMARNPQAKLLVPMIIGLALIESLVIYALLIAFNLVG